MLQKVLLVFAICFLSCINGQIPGTSPNVKLPFNINAPVTSKRVTVVRNVTTHFPTLFRDHVYHKLSDKGKEMFYASNIHPDCVAKKGNCIPRGQCIGRAMLYISRVCYRWDLVCCYDNNIRFPEVAGGSYVPPPPQHETHLNETQSTVYKEPTVLP